MTTMKAFITKHPVLTYFALTFVLSWGGFLLVGGSGLLAGTSWQADPRFRPQSWRCSQARRRRHPVDRSRLWTSRPSRADLSVAQVAGGRALVRGRAPDRPAHRDDGAPCALANLTGLSPRHRHDGRQGGSAAVRDRDRPRGRLRGGARLDGIRHPQTEARYGVLGTGLIVGAAWGAWHLLQMWWVGGTSSEALPLALFLPLFFLSAVAILTAYRVLMVWVYDRTGSLLVAVLMHASYIFSTLFVLAPPTTGVPFLTYSGVFAVALWVVVAASRRGQRRTALATTACEARGVKEAVHSEDGAQEDGMWTGLSSTPISSAWNAHDSAAVARHMADDAIYEDVALGRVLHGPSEIASFVEEATRSSSDFRFEVVSLFTAGNDYANEWVMLGTNDRELRGVPATGRSFRVRGASIGRLDASGRIVENRDYYNLAELLTQLGILPTAPSQPA